VIYLLNHGSCVTLAGTVLTDAMRREGYVAYTGPIPTGEQFKLVNGKLVCIDGVSTAPDPTKTYP